MKKQENINSLVELIRVLTKDEIIKLTTLIIPAECEKHGFVQGNYKLNKLL